MLVDVKVEKITGKNMKVRLKEYRGGSNSGAHGGGGDGGGVEDCRCANGNHNR